MLKQQRVVMQRGGERGERCWLFARGAAVRLVWQLLPSS